MLESTYQSRLIKKLTRLYPGSVILKNDSGYLQGIPDLTILMDYSFWAVLEVKASERAMVQPNQEYYIELLGQMSFAAFIYPENEAEVLNALQQSYEFARHSRFS